MAGLWAPGRRPQTASVGQGFVREGHRDVPHGDAVHDGGERVQVVGVGRVRREQVVCAEKVGGVPSSGVLLPFPAAVGQVPPPSSPGAGLGVGAALLGRREVDLGGVSWETPWSCWP